MPRKAKKTKRATSRRPRQHKRLDKLIQGIPGFDPLTTAGDCTFDYDAAQLALDFFPELLQHVKGALAGQPFVLNPWEAPIVANIFGWKRPDGTRRFREVYITVARKNNKTTFAAGLLLLVLFCDGEPGAECYSTAGEKEQAALIYDIASQMIRKEPELLARCRIFRSPRSIVLAQSASYYQPISAVANTKHGFNTHLVINDELHVQKNRELVDVLETSVGSRRQPLIIHTTTAGWDTNTVCWEKYTYASQVRDGVVKEPAFLPVIYEAPKDADWTKVATWRLANPNYGRSARKDYLRAAFNKARQLPAYENTFRRLHLNQWTEQADRWISLEKWDACRGFVDLASLEGKPCWAGLDLSSTTDLTALVLLFPLDDGRLFVHPHFFCPQEGAHLREIRDRVPYLTWGRVGHINLTPGVVVDYERVMATFRTAAESFDVRAVPLDRWNATHIITLLDNEGHSPVPFGQGFASMSAPCKELEKLVLSGGIVHNGHPVLRWNVNNAAVDTDAAENLKPSKKRSGDRIDGLVALIMALGEYMTSAEKDTTSVYETRGAIVL